MRFQETDGGSIGCVYIWKLELGLAFILAARSDLAVRACFFDPKVTDVVCELFATEFWLVYGGAGGDSSQTSAGGCSGIVLNRTYWGSMRLTQSIKNHTTTLGIRGCARTHRFVGVSGRKSCTQQFVPRSDTFPTASTASLGARCHAAHARASPRPSTYEVPRNTQVCTTVRVGVRRANRRLICSLHQLLPYHLARRPQHAFGTTRSSLESSPDLPDADPRAPQPACLHDSASGCVPSHQELICSFHRLLPYHLARRSQHAFGTTSSSLEPCVCLIDEEPRQKRVCWLLLLVNHLALGAME